MNQIMELSLKWRFFYVENSLSSRARKVGKLKKIYFEKNAVKVCGRDKQQFFDTHSYK